jgi:hypothetical protein
MAEKERTWTSKLGSRTDVVGGTMPMILILGIMILGTLGRTVRPRGRDTDLHDHWPKALSMDSCGFGRSSPKNSAISGRSAWQPIQKEVRTTGDDV